MEESIALPQFAPLPTSFVLHLLELTAEEFIFLLQRGSQHAYNQLLASLTQLEEKITTARRYVIDLMTPVLEQQQRVATWFQTTLREQVNQKPDRGGERKKVYSISNRTLATWQNNHILPSTKDVSHYLDRAGAILIASIVDERQRKQGYFPSYVAPNEPLFWCYARYSPTSPIVPCPLPLPATLPAGTLLWSRWPTTDRNWTRFDQWGAMRFSSIDRSSLARWDPSLNNANMSLLFEENRGFFGKMKPAALQNAANQILFRLAPDLLLSPSSPYVPMIPPLR